MPMNLSPLNVRLFESIRLQSLTRHEVRLHTISDKQSLKSRFYTPSSVENGISVDHHFKRIT